MNSVGWDEERICGICFVFTMSFIVREKSLATTGMGEKSLSENYQLIFISLHPFFLATAAVVLIRLTAAAGEAGSETLSSQFHRARA